MSIVQKHSSDLRLLPYPDGKTFGFTIIDDTDQSTLETARPIYDFLHELGLRTTKTVWAMDPEQPVHRPSDSGDTLEREEYAGYMRLLRNRGFEIALHNVSSQDSRRDRIAAGLERFREILGSYPVINVHHEKNQENLYFAFAQQGGLRPPPFRTAAFRALHRWLQPHRNGAGPRDRQCSGEDPGSEYFWGDLCRERIRYVRTNVFFRDLNTLGCNPAIPYTEPGTPFVNAWFDSSNGQDVKCFNSILSRRQIDALRRAEGCAILYTHFGKGFVIEDGGKTVLNGETRRRLCEVAGHPQGWYVPAGEMLDRLLAFQQVEALRMEQGIVLANHNPFEISSVTLRGTAGETYSHFGSGDRYTADEAGRIVLASLPARGTAAMVRAGNHGLRWYEGHGRAWRSDFETAARKLAARWRQYA